ncbi:hypothetical protein FB478_1097 [Arthrobacter sp. AG367]|nr:hypothetical protein FB478_1097 [Arthrobacter sp. AG367]
MTGDWILSPTVNVYSHLTEISFKTVIRKSWGHEPGVQNHQYDQERNNASRA